MGMIGYESIQKAFGVDIAVSNTMANAILLWANMYIDKAPWLTNDIHSLGLPAAIASEHARLVTMEAEYNITGSTRAEFLDKQFAPVRQALPRYVEYGNSRGGLVFKPYIDGNRIAVDYVQSGDFFPISFNSAGIITSAIFPEYKRDGKRLFVRLEYHIHKGTEYRIINRAFCSRHASITVGTILSLGEEIPLTDVQEWAEIEPDVILTDVESPLFSSYLVPMANNIDPYSPLGVSVYSRATSLIRDADEQYGAAIWEFRSKETAIQAGKEFYEKDRYGNIKFPAGKERMFQSFQDSGNNDKPLFNVFSPEIRDQSFYNGFNRILQRIEFNSGLAYGTLSDPQNVDKTAEEIKSSKQRSYATVKSMQNSLEDALDGLVYAMDYLTSLAGLAAEGEYVTAASWDDSIVVDAETKRKHDLEDLAHGVLSPWEYRVRHYGEDEETAKKNVPEQAGVIL